VESDRAFRQEGRTIFLDAPKWQCEPQGKTWTIGQKTSTRGQDGNRLRQAKFVIGRDVTDRRHPYFAAKPSTDSGSPACLQTCADRFTHSGLPVRATKQREMPMKRLISRAMYHPLIALSMFYLTDLMHNVDYSPAGAVLVLAAKSMSHVVRLFNKG
jgi:hypothetical protein